MTAETEAVRNQLLTKRPNPAIPAKDFLSTGSTLLNLASSGKPNGGLFKGGVYIWPGDSGAGKTWLALTVLAEATLNRQFDDYQLIADWVERGANMDIGHYFGKQLKKRLEPPSYSGTVPKYSHLAEEFYFNVDTACKRGPCVYVLDSMAALSSGDEMDKFQERKKAHEKGKETSGTYGMHKAKINSADMRVVHNLILQSGSILIILDQSRDKIQTGWSPAPQPQGQKTHAGGNATTFYAQQKWWFSIRKQIKTKVRGRNEEQGIIANVRVEKTRVTGRDRTVPVPILAGVGVDDLGGMVGWLVEREQWKLEGTRLKAPEFDFYGTVEQLVQKVQAEGREVELRHLTAKVWGEIEDACVVERKKRYE